MLATNYVYATLEGYYPRLLAKDGWHEALYLPVTSSSYTVALQLYTEQGHLVDLPTPGVLNQSFTVEWESGTPTTVTVNTSPSNDVVEVTFPEGSLAEARRGVLRMSPQSGTQVFYVYPIEVVVG